MREILTAKAFLYRIIYDHDFRVISVEAVSDDAI